MGSVGFHSAFPSRPPAGSVGVWQLPAEAFSGTCIQQNDAVSAKIPTLPGVSLDPMITVRWRQKGPLPSLGAFLQGLPHTRAPRGWGHFFTGIKVRGLPLQSRLPHPFSCAAPQGTPQLYLFPTAAIKTMANGVAYNKRNLFPHSPGGPLLPPQGSRGESFPSPFLSCWCCQQSLAFLVAASSPVIPISAVIVTCCSPCLRPNCPLPLRTPATLGWGPTLIQYDLILTHYICKDLFPNNFTFSGSRWTWISTQHIVLERFKESPELSTTSKKVVEMGFEPIEWSCCTCPRSPRLSQQKNCLTHYVKPPRNITTTTLTP